MNGYLALVLAVKKKYFFGLAGVLLCDYRGNTADT